MGMNQSRITPYHTHGNGVIKQSNRLLNDALRGLLLGRSQAKWDVVLPQIMRVCCNTPYSTTQKTPNFLKLDRGTRAPEHQTYHVLEPEVLSTWAHGKLIDSPWCFAGQAVEVIDGGNCRGLGVDAFPLYLGNLDCGSLQKTVTVHNQK